MLRSVTGLMSLGDIRTIISTHSRSTPRLQGSTYLEIYLLDKEKQRLETELSMLDKRRKRIDGRLAEIHEGMAKLVETRSDDGAVMPGLVPAGNSDAAVARGGPGPGAWRRLAVEY